MDEQAILARAGGACEICAAHGVLAAVAVLPGEDGVALCDGCAAYAAGHGTAPRALEQAIWSAVPAVQVLCWRLLRRDGPVDLFESMYLEPEVQAWAEAVTAAQDAGVVHRDSNGVVLAAGDTVTLIKDLPVKGGGFTAKRGTAVRGISLVADNPAHIEGRVEGQRIVILTEFVKKRL